MVPAGAWPSHLSRSPMLNGGIDLPSDLPMASKPFALKSLGKLEKFDFSCFGASHKTVVGHSLSSVTTSVLSVLLTCGE
jgi:hypothetical protein